jgi:ATPase subunit of ABC transporter with duplicated ATPase domains
VGASSLAAGHLTLVPELKAELEKLGRPDIMIVVGGVIPPSDVQTLIDMGAAAVYPPGSVIADTAIDLIEKLRIAMEESPGDATVARYSRAEEEFRVTGGYGAESEARSIAAGLGLGQDRLELPVGVLSGGERRRVELARILFAGSDVLCLDEPTNHLDIDAKTWLMGFLRQYKGALLVISHDLDLLDEAITRVLHLDRPGDADVGSIVEYRGTYSQYVSARAADEERQAKRAIQQAKEIDRLQGVVDRFGAKATKASMAHSVSKRIARLEGERVHAPRGGRHP